MVNVDPMGSLAPSDIVVSLGDNSYRLPAQSAAGWLALLISNDLDGVFPGLLDEDVAEQIDEQLWSGEISSVDIREAALDAITVAAGRDWWWALNLIAIVKHSWAHLYGRLVAHGFNIYTESLGAFLDAMYAVCVDQMDEERRREWDRALEQAPSGYRVIDEEREAQNFLALMNAKVQ